MKKEKNLLYNSDAYYNDNDYYELFSKKEDSLNIIDNYFKSLGNFDVILDAGCGTGKYLNTLENISNKYIGIDLSNDQLKKAKEKVSKENTKLINANLCNIPLEDNSEVSTEEEVEIPLYEEESDTTEDDSEGEIPEGGNNTDIDYQEQESVNEDG